ncbi:MAG TPA: HDOD domain-containing protein [Gammaproteobacteria bacterium]|nr:HDOD domain-containing protein [Gammaproteobacteria bacterium]
MPQSPATASPAPADPLQVRIGRQPIFDRELEVHGYELLFRGPIGDDAPATDGDGATSDTILNAFVEIGIERLTGGRPAFINLTRRFFAELPPLPFHPDSVVLEVLEDIPVDERLVEAVAGLHAAGYRVAIDDYLFESHWDPLLPHVSLIKVEINEETLDGMAQRLERLKALPVQLLAEKVETHEQYRLLHEMGFDLFQGFFFARPDVVQERRLAESTLVVTRILSRLHDPEVTIEELAALIGQDAALSFKLLRLVNSPAVGLRRQVESIHQAIVLLGLERIRAWATLFALAGRGDQPQELLNLGLVRANLCERLARETGLGRPDTAYTVGLLSVLDGLLSVPMAQALEELPLPEEVRAAIGRQEGDYGRLLAQAIALDQGVAVAVDSLPGLDPARLTDLFIESSEHAFATLAAL